MTTASRSHSQSQWRAPSATGPGPMPGTDPREAARVVMGECSALPFLPELADRGVAADLTARSLAMLADLPVDVSPRGWRLAGSTGRLARTARDLLDRDCDALEEADEQTRDAEAEPTPGDRRLQVRVVGPWSLAAILELPGGLPVLSDRGARRDLAASLAQGVADRTTRLAGRLRAGTRILLDEPMLWHVAAGTVPSPSRFDPIAAVPADQLSLSLCRFADTLRAAGVAEVLVRLPAGAAPQAPAQWSVVAETPRDETPLDGLCVSGELLHSGRSHELLDAAGTILSDGRVLQLEGLPGGSRPPRSGAEIERAAAELPALLHRLSAPRHSALTRLVLTPTAGELSAAGASPADVLATVRRVAETAPRMAE